MEYIFRLRINKILTVAFFILAFCFEAHAKSSSDYLDEMDRAEELFFRGANQDEAMIDEPHFVDGPADERVEAPPPGENPQPDIDGALQTAAITKVQQVPGDWAFEFLYVEPSGHVTVLSRYNARRAVMPASTQKIFTGYAAFTRRSYSLEKLAAMLHASNNSMANEALVSVAKTYGLVKNLASTGLAILKRDYQGLEDAEKYKAVDADGYSHANRVTAHLETSLLKKIYFGPDYEKFKNLLAHPFGAKCDYDTQTPQIGHGRIHAGHSTLRRSGELADRLYAKTGTFATTKSLAGFVDAKNGNGVLIFSIIGNGLRAGPFEAYASNFAVVKAHVDYIDENLNSHPASATNESVNPVEDSPTKESTK